MWWVMRTDDDHASEKSLLHEFKDAHKEHNIKMHKDTQWLSVTINDYLSKF